VDTVSHERAELIAELGEPVAWERRRTPGRGWSAGESEPTVLSAIWDCGGVYALAMEMKRVIETEGSSITESTRAQLANLVVEILFSASCLATEVEDGSEEWVMLNICKRHSLSLRSNN
jgi:hypothetical protein